MNRIAVPQTLLVLAFGLTLLTQGSNARGDTEAPRVVLGPGARDLVVGPGMNAAGRDLRGCEFVGQDLTRAKFDGCNLYEVRFQDCILDHASFRRAVFIGARVSVGPNLNGADFTDATINGAWDRAGDGFNFYGLELSPAQLMSTWSYKNKDLHQCAIRASYPYPSREVAGLDLRGADLREATVEGDCSKCDFTNARIFGAFFGNNSITFEQLASTLDFKKRRLRVRLASAGKPGAASSRKWDFSHINLAGSDLWFHPSDADFTDATINDCTIRHGLTKAQLYSTRSYRRGNLSGLRLMESDLSGCDLSGMNLSGCLFSHCKFAGTIFADAVITGARLDSHSHFDPHVAEADRLTVEQIKSTWNYKHGRMAGIVLPKEIADALRDK